MTRLQDLTGEVFGYYTIIDKCFRKNNRTYCKCLCKCGNTKEILLQNLKSGCSKSCGCPQYHGKTTHGMTKSKEYNIWTIMRQRCNNPNNEKYRIYGARGIKICKRWDKFKNFYEDMGPKPYDKSSIDRKDNNLGYCLDNCRWATVHEQVTNRRVRNKYIGVRKTSSHKYYAYIFFNNKQHNLGIFTIEKDAAKAYDDKSEEIYNDRPNETERDK